MQTKLSVSRKFSNTELNSISKHMLFSMLVDDPLTFCINGPFLRNFTHKIPLYTIFLLVFIDIKAIFEYGYCILECMQSYVISTCKNILSMLLLGKVKVNLGVTHWERENIITISMLLNYSAPYISRVDQDTLTCPSQRWDRFWTLLQGSSRDSVYPDHRDWCYVWCYHSWLVGSAWLCLRVPFQNTCLIPI